MRFQNSDFRIQIENSEFRLRIQIRDLGVQKDDLIENVTVQVIGWQ
jgi:hypothetical protein